MKRRRTLITSALEWQRPALPLRVFVRFCNDRQSLV